MKKRLIAIGMVLVLALTGCSDGADDGDDVGDVGDTTVTTLAP